MTEAQLCEQLAQSRYLTAEWQEVKPASSELQVKCLNHYTTRHNNVVPGDIMVKALTAIPLIVFNHVDKTAALFFD